MPHQGCPHSGLVGFVGAGLLGSLRGCVQNVSLQGAQWGPFMAQGTEYAGGSVHTHVCMHTYMGRVSSQTERSLLGAVAGQGGVPPGESFSPERGRVGSTMRRVLPERGREHFSESQEQNASHPHPAPQMDLSLWGLFPVQVTGETQTPEHELEV